MDLFDILWLVVCLGLPVISGIAASAEKKKKAQGRPVVTQEPEGNDLPSWMEQQRLVRAALRRLRAEHFS